MNIGDQSPPTSPDAGSPRSGNSGVGTGPNSRSPSSATLGQSAEGASARPRGKPAKGATKRIPPEMAHNILHGTKAPPRSPTDGQLGGLCRNLASDLGYRGENDMVGKVEASTSINFSTAPTRSHLLAWWGTFPYCREITNAPHGLAYGYAFAAAEAQLHDTTDALFRLPEGVRGEKAARKGKNIVNVVGRLFHHLCLPIDHALGTAISSEPFLEAIRASPVLRPLILCDPGTLTQAQLDTPNAIFMTMHRRQPLLLYREAPLSCGTLPTHVVKWEVGDRVIASTADNKPAHGAVSSVKAGGHYQVTTDDGTILPIRGANKMRVQLQPPSPPGVAASLPAAPRD